MQSYVDRLVKCGYERDRAYRSCMDFIANLSLFDLQCFVVSMERLHNVENV